jgi:hypothetical protein
MRRYRKQGAADRLCTPVTCDHPKSNAKIHRVCGSVHGAKAASSDSYAIVAPAIATDPAAMKTEATTTAMQIIKRHHRARQGKHSDHSLFLQTLYLNSGELIAWLIRPKVI